MKYIGIADDIGYELWVQNDPNVIAWVPLEQFDTMVDVGYIDLDGAVLVDLGDLESDLGLDASCR